MSVHFTLSEIDSDFPPQKEVIRIGDSSFKPFSTEFLSKKRKVDELYDLETPASNLLMATDILIDKYSEKTEMIDNLVAAQKKVARKLEKAKQKIKILKAMLAKKSDHASEEGSDAKSTFLEEVKRDATIAVLESKIHMATEAAENGLDSSLWDVKAWKDKLSKLKDDYVVSPFFIGLGGSKAPKRSAYKAPMIKIIDTLSKGETSHSKGDEDMAVTEDPVNSEESSGEDDI